MDMSDRRGRRAAPPSRLAAPERPQKDRRNRRDRQEESQNFRYEYEDRPRSRRSRADYDDEDYDRPRSRRSRADYDDEDYDRPRSRRSRTDYDDEDYDRPRSRRSRADYDDEDYDEAPRPRRGRADYDDEDYDEAPRPRRGRPDGASRSWLWTVYKVLVAISAVIVLGYLAFWYMTRPPEQAQLPPPSVETGRPTDGTTPPPTSEGQLSRRKEVYTVLLAATDKEGTRTDTMMVMTYDVPNQKVGVVSVPRDTLTRREKGKNPRLVYGPGKVDQRRDDIANMLGIPIDYYVKVDIRGFIALVDYLGGVDFYVPSDMNYDDPVQDLHIHYKQGKHHLNGQKAMEVARFRKNNDLSGYSDVGRTQTQQALLIALAEKLLSWDSLTKINGFVKIFNEHVDTDMKMNDMLYFASKVFDGAKNSNLMSSVETATLEGRGDAIYGHHRWCYELDPEKTLDTVNRLLNPYTRDLTLDDMDLVKGSGYMQ